MQSHKLVCKGLYNYYQIQTVPFEYITHVLLIVKGILRGLWKSHKKENTD